MNKKSFAWTLVLSLTLLSGLASAEARDLPANHCELFVDRMVAFSGARSSRNITLYLKTLNDRLDGNIIAVGFRGQERALWHGGRPGDWTERLASAFMEAPNYWKVTFSVASDFHQISLEGAFFVRTDKNTYYWLNPVDRQNYVFDDAAFRSLAALTPGRTDDALNSCAQTRQYALRAFNPQRCQ